MDDRFENEVLTAEELTKLNEKLKNTENITLPKSLSPEKIEEKLNSQDIQKPEKKATSKSRKRKIYSFVAFAASFAIVVTSLMLAKPWNKGDIPPVDGGRPSAAELRPQDYSEIEKKFSDYADKYEKYQNSYRLYNLVDDVIGSGIYKGDASATVQNGTAAPETATGSEYKNVNEIAESEEHNHGETNEQVKGVNEADIIKNDGKYIYAVNPDNSDWGSFYDQLYVSEDFAAFTYKNGETQEDDTNTGTAEIPVLDYDCKISVIEPKKDGKLEKKGEINITAGEKNGIYHMAIREIYVKGNRLLALVDCTVAPEITGNNKFKYQQSIYFCGESITMAVCFDISDKENAKEMWRIYQDGNYISSRLVENQLVFLSNYYVDLSEGKENVVNNCVPKIATGNAPMERVSCDCLVVGMQVESPNYLVASTVNIEDDSTLKTQAILGAGSNVYCTAQTLYATTTVYEDSNAGGEIFGVADEKTSIYKFDITNGDIKYSGCGSVKGYALNQFSIDEFNGCLRIATTTGNWGDTLSNHIYVLNDALKIVGEISGIAKGETIKSVRFSGNTGYVVTFEQTDPLFVIDLSNPEKPELKGELKIPGFSTYLHPVGDNLLLGVGVDGTNDGQGNGMKISLFDVSDPENPVEADKIEFSGIDSANRWTYICSEAFISHKALCWDNSNSVMYIPYAKQDRIWASTRGDELSYTKTDGVLAVKVDTQSKKLTTDGNYMSTSSRAESYSDFSRVTYIGDVIIAFAGYTENGCICSFDKTTQMLSDTLVLND